MPIGKKLTDRYQIKQTLGLGGIGVVYWAYDIQNRRDVALKTICNVPEPAALELFHKECNALASISHPNIIEIFDIGKYPDQGVEKPYFVMPLLKGETLDSLIRGSSPRLTVERTVDILCQTCLGLQAAHENGLVHRDLKPANIFVLDDDSVKIVDFGVAYMADGHAGSEPQGTPLYLSPEQIQRKPASALSDIFTLGVVAYEAFTLQHPFDGGTDDEIADAVLQHIAPPVSDLNPAVSLLLARVVHKTMAKQPWNRFSTARELSEAFRKALRNETPDTLSNSFELPKIQPRLDRAGKALEAGDLQSASEILKELEAEGHLVPEMSTLRSKIDQGVRQKTLAKPPESERAPVNAQELPPAPHNVALLTEQIDPQIESSDHPQAATPLPEAQAEFPDDTKLVELAKVIRQGEERTASTQALVDRARAFCVHGRFDDAARLFRQAYEADERDLVVRGLLVDTLAQHSRSLLDNDWRRAAELVESALKLDPANPQVRSVAALVADRKRDEAVDQCCYHARQLQAKGDIAGAVAAVDQGLSLNPAAPRLLQLKTALQPLGADAGGTPIRIMDLEKLKRLEEQSQSTRDPNQLREILAAVRELAAKHLDDLDFQAVLIAMEKRYVALSRVAAPSVVGPAHLDAPAAVPRSVPPQVPAPPPVPRAEVAKTPNVRPPNVVPVVEVIDLRPPTQKPPEVKPPVAAAPEVKPPVVPPPVPIVPVVPPVDAKPPDTRAAFRIPVVRPPDVKPPEPAIGPPQTGSFATIPPMAAPVVPTRPPAPVPAPPLVPPQTWGGPVPPGPPQKPPAARNWKLWGAFAAGFALVAAAGVGTVLWHQHQAGQSTLSATGAATVPVDIRTVPEGATISVNSKASGTSNLQLKLAPGTYRIDAVREGYRPSQTTVTVTSGHGASANLDLQAMPTTVRLTTDFASAAIVLDGKPQSGLQSGQLILDNVAGGSHVLTIGSGTSAASIHFDVREGSPPVVTGIEAPKETSAILITNLGSRARIYSSQKVGSFTFDGKPSGTLDPAGVELTNLTPGDHQIAIGEGADRKPVVYETALVPALTIYFNSPNQSLGTLLVTTGEDDVHISIDGKPIRTVTRRGQLRLPNLPPKQYAISVTKEGFQPVPEQHVTIKKGEEAKLAFQLHPIPNIATLHVAGAVPGTQVLVDGKSAGTVGQDGTIQLTQVAPGSHAVELRKEDFRPKTFQLNFAAGKEVTLTGADVVLEGTFGTLVVAVAPAGAQVTIQRSGDSQARQLTGNSVRLPEGSYTVTASAPHFITQSARVDITVGSTKNINLPLSPERITTAPKPASHLGMSGWQAAWQPDGDHFTRKGGNLCLYSPQGPGTYSFTASMKRGKQLRWVAHVINDKNYAEFELDNEFFYRRLVVDGKGKEGIKRRHGLAMESVVAASLQVTITPNGIIHRLQRPDGWVVLDSWLDATLHEGRFGFLIRGRDEVNLSAFWFAGSE